MSTSSFVSPFGNGIIPSEESYFRYYVTDGQNYTLQWPDFYVAGTNVILAANYVELVSIDPISAGVRLPNVTQASVGSAVIIYFNTPTGSLSVQDQFGNSVQPLSAGNSYLFIVNSNVIVGSSAVNNWTRIAYGTGSVNINAAALAGPSLTQLNNQLVVNPIGIELAADATITQAYRGSLLTYSGNGIRNVSLTPLTNGFFFHAANAGLGSLIFTPTSGQIDGTGSKTLAPNETATFVYTGTEYLSLGFSRSTIFQFQQKTYNLISPYTNITLLGAQPETILDFVFPGDAPLSQNQNVIFPNVKQVWFVRVIGGDDQQVTLSVPGGNTLILPAANSSPTAIVPFNIIITNGANAIYASGTGGGGGGSTVIAATGDVTNPSFTFVQDGDTGFYDLGNQTGIGVTVNGVQSARFTNAGIFVKIVDGGVI